MKHRRTHAIKILTVLGAVLLLGVTVAWAGEQAETRRRAKSLKAAGLKVYWSLLREDQKPQAKAILGDFLVETQPDRLQAFARLVRLKADVSAVLTAEQRREGWASKQRFRALSEDERRAVVHRLLSETDRGALADRVARMEDATPAERVDLGIEILGQVGDVLEAEMTRTLDLTDVQRTEIRALYDEALDELRPVATRLATAKAATAEHALALLDADQRAKVEHFAADVRAKVLAFLRG